MERFIQQLIEDLHQATYNFRPPHCFWAWSQADPLNDLELEDMSFAEKYYFGKEEPISSITGIEFERLPWVEELDLDQQGRLASELEKLLDYFHFKLEFPTGYPAHLRYPFIKKFWEESHVPLSFGTNHIEFCEQEKEDCPFPGFCTICDDVEAQLKHDEETCGKSEMAPDLDFFNLLPGVGEIEAWAKNLTEFKDEDEAHPPLMNDENEVDFPPFLNGLYNDDGTEVNPNEVPVPGLCVICKKYQMEDWEENLLCLMNRNDQRDSDDFKCGEFEKI